MSDAPDRGGVLPYQWIRTAVERGWIRSDAGIEDDQAQPNSLDLRLGSRCHRVQSSFLPGPEGIGRKLDRFAWYDFPLVDEGSVLERNTVYLVPLRERLALPPEVRARANPKSSTGRLDVFTRVVTEHGDHFDDVPAGYQGPLFVEIVPRSFAIVVRPGDSLVQIRFARGPARLEDDEIRDLAHRRGIVVGAGGEPLPPAELRYNEGVFLSVRLTASDPSELIGYRARKNTPPIDLGHRGMPIARHWETIHPADGPVILEPDEFYLFSSKERVRIPPAVCAEMVPFDASRGELRTHYAGFFDSGFGAEPADPASVVLEVRNRDVPFLLEDGHPLFRLQFFHNAERPEILYGSPIQSHYQSQGLKLAKQFGAEADAAAGGA